MNPTDQITLMVDVKTRKVGCVIIQAIHGLSPDKTLLGLFDWEVNHTPDMRPVTGTREQWEKLAQQQQKS